jgi:hypothetical protein
MYNIATTGLSIAQPSHNPFQVGLGFQTLCPIDVAMTFVATQADSAHVQFEFDKENNFNERIQHIFSPVSGRHIIAGPTYFRDDIFPGPHDIRWFSAHGFCRWFSISG